MILEILKHPNETLRKVSEPIGDDEFNENLRSIIVNMFDTMYSTRGIGLAGIQVGIDKRIVVIDVSKVTNNFEDCFTLINPEILDFNGNQQSPEGCLSVPNIYKEVERHDDITVKYKNINGDSIQRECSGLLSACIQHEIDHLNGRLFIDYEE